MLSLKVVKRSTEAFLLVFIHNLLYFVDAGEDYLGEGVAAISCQLKDVFVKTRLLLSVGDLVNGTIEDKADAVRFSRESCGTRDDLGREKFSVALPKLPEEVRVSKIPLLNESLVCYLPSDYQV